MVYKIVCLLLLLIVCPMIIGSLWLKFLEYNKKWSFCLLVGIFTELALFQLLSIPFVFFHWKFSVLRSIFVLVVFLLSLYGLISKSYRGCRIGFIKPNSLLEYILLFCVLIVISIQLYRSIIYDITYMSYDDAGYTVYSVDALAVDRLGLVDDYTGIGRPISYKYAVSSWLYFPALISSLSNVSVATLLHTVLNVYAIVLAYSSCWLMAGELFIKFENQLAFLLFISVFYWFGYHSHYSLTFRLLGPNYQGKAIVAVTLTPLLLTILLRQLKESYDWQTAILFFILSVSATALTLWGAGTFIVMLIAIIVISMFRKERKWKHLLYIPVGCVYPMLFFIGYILFKYGI